ncbi:hypothetical protein ACJX0J_015959, partial [Zea mays]
MVAFSKESVKGHALLSEPRDELADDEGGGMLVGRFHGDLYSEVAGSLLISLILSGDFFLAAVVACTLAKLEGKKNNSCCIFTYRNTTIFFIMFAVANLLMDITLVIKASESLQPIFMFLTFLFGLWWPLRVCQLIVYKHHVDLSRGNIVFNFFIRKRKITQIIDVRYALNHAIF